MRMAIALIFTVGFIVSTSPSFAQGSCEGYCTKRCAAAQQKSYCMGQCVPACNARSKKK